MRQNDWTGKAIKELNLSRGVIMAMIRRGRDLDISRQTIIVMVKRNGMMMVPKGELVLLEGDHVILYSKAHIADAELIRL